VTYHGNVSCISITMSEHEHDTVDNSQDAAPVGGVRLPADTPGAGQLKHGFPVRHSLVLFAAGFAAAHFRMLAGHRAEHFGDGEVAYRMWVIVLSTAVGGTLSLCPLHSEWLLSLRRSFEPRMPLKRIGLLIVMVLVGAFVFGRVLGANGVSGDRELEQQLVRDTRPLMLVSLGATTVGWTIFLAIPSFARSSEFWSDIGASKQIEQVLRLRRELRRLLTSFGALLALLVVATGMRRHAVLAFRPEDNLPVEGVVLYGLAFASILGGMYLVANRAVSARADRIADWLAPLPAPRYPGFSDLLKHRNDLQGLMTPSGAFESFQTVVFIAGPLISALVGSAVGK
jgi:uncharacterized membrane protein